MFRVSVFGLLCFQSVSRAGAITSQSDVSGLDPRRQEPEISHEMLVFMRVPGCFRAPWDWEPFEWAARVFGCSSQKSNMISELLWRSCFKVQENIHINLMDKNYIQLSMDIILPPISWILQAARWPLENPEPRDPSHKYLENTIKLFLDIDLFFGGRKRRFSLKSLW